jgi:hypothetical protein
MWIKDIRKCNVYGDIKSVCMGYKGVSMLGCNGL